MKKKLISVFSIVALMFFLGQVSFAQAVKKKRDVQNKFGVGARISYLRIFDDEIEGGDIEFGSTASFGGNLTYFFNKIIALELSLDYAKADMDFGPWPFLIEVGELKQIPILLTGRIHLPTTTTATFYLGAGIGYYFNSFDLSSNLLLNVPAGTDADADDSFGFHFNLGIEYFFIENVAINLDLKYILNETDFEGNIPGLGIASDEIDLNAFGAGLGFKYYF